LLHEGCNQEHDCERAVKDELGRQKVFDGHLAEKRHKRKAEAGGKNAEGFERYFVKML
jgi:hypothetical protein